MVSPVVPWSKRDPLTTKQPFAGNVAVELAGRLARNPDSAVVLSPLPQFDGMRAGTCTLSPAAAGKGSASALVTPINATPRLAAHVRRVRVVTRALGANRLTAIATSLPISADLRRTRVAEHVDRRCISTCALLSLSERTTAAELAATRRNLDIASPSCFEPGGRRAKGPRQWVAIHRHRVAQRTR